MAAVQPRQRRPPAELRRERGGGGGVRGVLRRASDGGEVLESGGGGDSCEGGIWIVPLARGKGRCGYGSRWTAATLPILLPESQFSTKGWYFFCLPYLL